MFARDVWKALVDESVEVLSESSAGLFWLDDVVDETSLSCAHRVCETSRVVVGVLFDVFGRCTAVQDLDSPFGAHDRGKGAG